jgi:REP element-mobilizing transposase RayT
MARLARVVIPGLPHQVTQRGNGRSRVFFSDADYALYRDLLAASCRDAGVDIWAWCLMPSHVHLILVPRDEDGLRRALAPVHRRYAGILHQRRRRTGHFWQGRFGAVVMDEDHLTAAFRYGSVGELSNRLKRAPPPGTRPSRPQAGETPAIPVACLFSGAGLALRVHIFPTSESMGDHDSEIMDDGCID